MSAQPQVQEAEVVEEVVETVEEQTPRDYEAEARAQGWLPPEEFKGDKSKCVDAKTFVDRADTFMPFLKKQNASIKQEFAEFKRETRKALKYMGEAEQRGYERALAELQVRHDEAVETGDVRAARQVLKEIGELPKPAAEPADEVDVTQFQKRLGEWIQESDWYLADETKTKYADIQSDMIIREHGALHQYPGGLEDALKEIERRVERKFAAKKPSPTNGAGNREAKGKGGRTLADLPPDARAQAVKWDKSGLVKVDDYLKNYEWN